MNKRNDWLSYNNALREMFQGVTDHIERLSPSEVAEKYRYLGSSVGAKPGAFRYSHTPYLKEIVDQFDVGCPTREVAGRKGVQIGATTGILENIILYNMVQVKSSPCMMLTADQGLAKRRVDGFLIPMILDSGLNHLLQASDYTNKRKTGKAPDKLEWAGGGALYLSGANNPDRQRSIPIQVMLRDEIDTFPADMGGNGDSLSISEGRTTSFENTKKILDISTPLIKYESNIDDRFYLGDQREYHVPCKSCGELQTLTWNKYDKESGAAYGIHFESDQQGRIVEDSTRFLCKFCGHSHINEDKYWLLSEKNGAKWVPMAEASRPHLRSYHIPSLLAPVGSISWESIAVKWSEAWDIVTGRVKNVEKLQAFYNQYLGLPFETMGTNITFSIVSSHRRPEYHRGEIPNRYASDFCDSEILVVIGSVDVQDKDLSVTFWGWTRGHRVFLVDYLILEGDATNLSDKNTWGKLRKLTNKIWNGDNGVKYRMALGGIDSGYNSHLAYAFCNEEQNRGVWVPIMGMPDQSTKSSREFKQSLTKIDTARYDLNVNLYKERWRVSLGQLVDTNDQQPEYHFNAPMDLPDKMLKELTHERRKRKINKDTGQHAGYVWHRTKGVRNEL